jgi:hypothetical protein
LQLSASTTKSTARPGIHAAGTRSLNMVVSISP